MYIGISLVSYVAYGDDSRALRHTLLLHWIPVVKVICTCSLYAVGALTMHMQQAGAPAPAPTPLSRQALVLADLARLGRRMFQSRGTLPTAPIKL